MKKILMFMLLIFGVLFTATAVTEKPIVKDVGFECSINLDAQNYDVVQMMQQTQITLYATTDVNLQSEGLLTLKYPLLNSNLYYNYFSLKTNEIRLAKTSDTMILLSYKYPFLC